MRQTDHAWLTSPRARELIREEGVVLTDYRRSRDVWAARNGDEPGRAT